MITDITQEITETPKNLRIHDLNLWMQLFDFGLGEISSRLTEEAPDEKARPSSGIFFWSKDWSKTYDIDFFCG